MANKASYGKGHPIFLEYVKRVAQHPVYKDMPDAYLDSGDIQWEAPTNRKSGKFKDTNIKRRRWWEDKAKSIGINTSENEWISRTAKAIHPTKERPCKNCGRVMDIRYAYPSTNLLNRIARLPYFHGDFDLDPFEHITELIERLYEKYDTKLLPDIHNLLKCKGVNPPKQLPNIEDWISWIENTYIPAEPSMLSPGAMANPPDRFDGFHSLNRCCRAKVDPGRWKANMQSYTTDRRAFEHWCDGDWIAADRLMGQVSSNPIFQGSDCLFGHPGPCSADHIGPISLGFAHRPEFQLLCRSCNSAKNNRMFLSDVEYLREIEESGERVISWYAQDIWNKKKHDIDSREKATRLSKVLRDNRYTAMVLLNKVKESGNYVFLSSLLGLDYADYNVTFNNLSIDNYKTSFKSIKREHRTTKYAMTQKVRRFKVAFETLSLYIEKENRNAALIWNDKIEERTSNLLITLNQNKTEELRFLDEKISEVFNKEIYFDDEIKEIIESLPDFDQLFSDEMKQLTDIMGEVSHLLNNRWEDDRYIRVTENEGLLED